MEGFGDGLDELGYLNDAEVVVGDEREAAWALSGGVLQDDGAGFGDGCGAGGEDALASVELIDVPVSGVLESESGRKPRFRQSLGDGEALLVSGLEDAGDCFGDFRLGAAVDAGVVLEEAVFEEFEESVLGESSGLLVGARDGLVFGGDLGG